MTDEGDTEITFVLSNYQSVTNAHELEKGTIYRIKADVLKSARTIEQNRILWVLIHEIATARGTERANDDWSIYLEALERAGAKYEYIACLPEAVPPLKEQFRAVQVVNYFDHHGQKMAQCKVYIGSSKMDTKEMSILIDTVKDMAAAVGIYDI